MVTVNSLQKQIRQYLTACSGIEVVEVCVQVETAMEDAKDSPYAIPEPDAVTLVKEPAAPAAPKVPVMPEPVAAPVVAQPVPEPVPVKQVGNFDEDEPKRPLHQRLFGHPEQPVIVPMPPVQVQEPSSEQVDEPFAAEAEVTPEPETPQLSENEATEEEKHETN